MKYFLSLGSNLGDKISNLNDAIFFLKGKGKVSTVSSIYKTSPVNMPENTEYFLNLVLELESKCSPDKLLDAIKEYERKKGRKKRNQGYDSRIIDIDILLVNNKIIKKKSLVVPHPEMTKRAFVLIPLNEIAPDFVHPVQGKRMQEILTCLDTTETVIKINRKPIV